MSEKCRKMSIKIDCFFICRWYRIAAYLTATLRCAYHIRLSILISDRPVVYSLAARRSGRLSEKNANGANALLTHPTNNTLWKISRNTKKRRHKPPLPICLIAE